MVTNRSVFADTVLPHITYTYRNSEAWWAGAAGFAGSSAPQMRVARGT